PLLLASFGQLHSEFKTGHAHGVSLGDRMSSIRKRTRKFQFKIAAQCVEHALDAVDKGNHVYCGAKFIARYERICSQIVVATISSHHAPVAKNHHTAAEPSSSAAKFGRPQPFNNFHFLSLP